MFNNDFEPPRSGLNRKPPEFTSPPPPPPLSNGPPYLPTTQNVDNRHYYRDDLAQPRVYSVQQPLIESEDDELEYDRVDCTPHMCAHPYALLRWFELVMYFILHWLVQVSCANTTCTMILNEFGDKAVLQSVVLLVIVGLAFADIAILVAYSLNAHKAYPDAVLGFERAYAVGGVVLLFISGIIGSVYAAQTAYDTGVNELGRGASGIRPQWIAAAVLEFLTALLLLADFMGQRREGFPFVYGSKHDEEAAREKARRKREKRIREHRIRQSLY